MQKYLKVLQAAALFRNMDEPDILTMLACLNVRIKEYKKDEYIWQTGDEVQQVGLVLGGEVLVIKDDLHGNRSILSSVLPGDVFGEAFSCAGLSDLPVSVLALSRCTIMMIDYKRIINTCSNTCTFHIQLIENMLRILAEKNIALTQKIAHMSQRTTRGKLLAYLSEAAIKSPSKIFSIPFNRQELADYLCVDRSAMSSELSKLRAEGILDFDKNDFKFLKLYKEE